MAIQPGIAIQFKPPILSLSSHRLNFPPNNGLSHDFRRDLLVNDRVLDDLCIGEQVTSQCSLDRSAHGFNFWKFGHGFQYEIHARRFASPPPASREQSVPPKRMPFH